MKKFTIYIMQPSQLYSVSDILQAVMGHGKSQTITCALEWPQWYNSGTSMVPLSTTTGTTLVPLSDTTGTTLDLHHFNVYQFGDLHHINVDLQLQPPSCRNAVKFFFINALQCLEWHNHGFKGGDCYGSSVSWDIVLFSLSDSFRDLM